MGKNRGGPQGKLYKIKTQEACRDEGIPYVSLPKGVAGHMIVVLTHPDSHRNVKFATITSKAYSVAGYFPIAPTKRRPYRFQLHLRHYNNQCVGNPSALPWCSYVRAEKHVVPFEALVELEGDFGEHLMLKSESVDKLVAAMRDIRLI